VSANVKDLLWVVRTGQNSANAVYTLTTRDRNRLQLLAAARREVEVYAHLIGYNSLSLHCSAPVLARCRT
jgi:hypothetical protein